MKVEQLKWEDLENIEIEGVDTNDYPDFCDAFLARAEYDGVELNDDQLEYMQENFQDQFYQEVFESLL